ncbi:MAG: hypothetical protein KA250_07935 [Verrucomicrobiales bacterium]|nr:hypothetical protein [Verrucomicrobiales bacterium]MBP9224851.1 hypothetical protein [Verrucomicrobiales bacterium]HQZ27114.1 hypothetical protein [Verrucomicrobiales bacterium]
MSDFTAVFIAIVFVVVAFVLAMNRGVVKMLASGMAAAVALVVFFVAVPLLPALAKSYVDIDLTWKLTATVAGSAAFLSYVISRILFGILFRSMFNPDGWFHWWVDGIPGGFVSFLPSAVVVFFLFCCVRFAGTLQELNYLDSLTQEGISEMGGKIPPFPFSASWRNGIESLPMVAFALDLVDPYSNRAHRNAAAMVITSKSPPMVRYFLLQPETGELMERDLWSALRADSSVSLALAKLDRIGLILAPAIREAASTPDLVVDLTTLVLKPVVEGYTQSIPRRLETPQL